MTVSQNGYKSRDFSLIATYTVVRDVKLSLRKGDISVVLLHFARWYDKNIEPLTKSDTGGYNPRAIPGSKIDSNHASGTAMDLRWAKHALGKKGTFTKAQKDKITKQLGFYEGVIRWGENYTTTVDGMHYEINKGPAEVARIAKKCKAADAPKPAPKPTPKPPAVTVPPRPPILEGKRLLVIDGNLGEATIRRWQEVMGTPVDGKISEKSSLVEAVQRRLKATVDHSLVVDGEGSSLDFGVPRKTVEALQRYLRRPITRRLSSENSDTIKALQRRLNEGHF